MSDEQASGDVRAVHAAGLRVPEDVSVSGWDDAAVAALLDLTTVAQSLRDQGAACAAAALGEQQTPQPAPWSIVRRASTADLGVRLREWSL